jgi:hypothetical protein
MLARLRVAVTILNSLGGPELLVASKLANQGYGVGSNPIQVASGGLDALRDRLSCPKRRSPQTEPACVVTVQGGPWDA